VVYHYTIKGAADAVGIKYSTAKTIYKVYKNEGRAQKQEFRSRCPGISKDEINKIAKAPRPAFQRRNYHQDKVCGIAEIVALVDKNESNFGLQPQVFFQNVSTAPSNSNALVKSSAEKSESDSAKLVNNDARNHPPDFYSMPPYFDFKHCEALIQERLMRQ